METTENWKIASGTDAADLDAVYARATCLRCGVRVSHSGDSMQIHDDFHERVEPRA